MIRKLVHFSCWELETKLCGLLVGWAEVIRQKVSFSLVCVCVCVHGCVCVCGAEGGLGGHDQASNAALEAIYL